MPRACNAGKAVLLGLPAQRKARGEKTAINKVRGCFFILRIGLMFLTIRTREEKKQRGVLFSPAKGNVYIRAFLKLSQSRDFYGNVQGAM